MCGIFGEFAPYPSRNREAWLASARSSVRRRGPDGDGMWLGERCALGHTRLAILDVDARASQPMTSASGQTTLVFNGEIYNYIELRSLMNGWHWRTSSDTEVLLELLERDGERALRNVVGMFACAIYDRRTGNLSLFRDRLGKKPLYHTTLKTGAFRFASDISALLADEEQGRTTDLGRLAEFLQHGYIAEPRTGFEGISTVPPGHWLHVSRTDDGVRTQLRRYWSMPRATGSKATHVEWLEEFRETLESAVRLRLRSDVPLGAFLSGGVDSSIISLLATRQSPALTTFTMDFSESEFSEGPYAAEVAQHIGSSHVCSTISDDLSIESVCDVYSDLHGDSSALPTIAICREARKYVTVALSGDGGDELLGGYSRYSRALKRIGMIAGLPSFAHEMVRNVISRAIPFWLPGASRLSRVATDLAGFYSRDVKMYAASSWPPVIRRSARTLCDPVIEALIRNGDRAPLHRLMTTDVETYLPGDILVKVDRASMACGLEVRSPLLDHRLFELVARAQPSWLLSETGTKDPLRRLYAPLLPARVFARQKQGFGVPLSAWLDTHRIADIEKRILSPNSPLVDVILPTQVRRMFQSHKSKLYLQPGRIWHLLVMTAWAQRWRPTVVDA